MAETEITQAAVKQGSERLREVEAVIKASGRYPLPDYVRTHRLRPRVLSIVLIAFWILSLAITAPKLIEQQTRSRTPLIEKRQQKHYHPESFDDIQGLTLISERLNVNRQ